MIVTKFKLENKSRYEIGYLYAKVYTRIFNYMLKKEIQLLIFSLRIAVSISLQRF